MNLYSNLLFHNFDDSHIKELEKIFSIKTEYAGDPSIDNKAFFKGYYSYLTGIYSAKAAPVYLKIYENQMLDKEKRYTEFDKLFYSLGEVARISKRTSDSTKKYLRNISIFINIKMKKRQGIISLRKICLKFCFI